MALSSFHLLHPYLSSDASVVWFYSTTASVYHMLHALAHYLLPARPTVDPLFDHGPLFRAYFVELVRLISTDDDAHRLGSLFTRHDLPLDAVPSAPEAALARRLLDGYANPPAIIGKISSLLSIPGLSPPDVFSEIQRALVGQGLPSNLLLGSAYRPALLSLRRHSIESNGYIASSSYLLSSIAEHYHVISNGLSHPSSHSKVVYLLGHPKDLDDTLAMYEKINPVMLNLAAFIPAPHTSYEYRRLWMRGFTHGLLFSLRGPVMPSATVNFSARAQLGPSPQIHGRIVGQQILTQI